MKPDPGPLQAQASLKALSLHQSLLSQNSPRRQSFKGILRLSFNIWEDKNELGLKLDDEYLPNNECFSQFIKKSLPPRSSLFLDSKDVEGLF